MLSLSVDIFQDEPTQVGYKYLTLNIELRSKHIWSAQVKVSSKNLSLGPDASGKVLNLIALTTSFDLKWLKVHSDIH